MKISLIIPMYNESAIIADALQTFSSYMESRFEDWELIFVDDGSSDGCGNAVAAAHEKDERIRLCRYTPNRGKGHAVRTGVLAAKGDVILFTDCDNAYGEEAIGRLADLLAESGADIVVGSRNLSKDGYEGYTFLRRVASKLYIKVLCIVGGFKLSDSQCGCKAYEREAARDIFSRCKVNGFAFDFETILWAGKLGYEIKEMPVKIINHRDSKVNVLRDSVRMLRDLIRIKKDVKNARV